jgi:hypothetical protein
MFSGAGLACFEERELVRLTIEELKGAGLLTTLTRGR